MPTEQTQVSGADLEEQAALAASDALEQAKKSLGFDDAKTAQVLAAAWAEIRNTNYRTL